MTDFKQEIVFHPAWDKRSSNPTKNYGIHGVEIMFLLTGPRGVIQFVIFTNWHLPHVKKELLSNRLNKDIVDTIFAPYGADLGYHSPVPMYEGQDTVFNSCPYLDNKPCYYDGSGLNAKPVFALLLQEGSAAVWKRLEEEYERRFGND